MKRFIALSLVIFLNSCAITRVGEIIPGKMYSESYRERGLSSVNLSRTIEDSGTVTSVLIPWNTCGAYQSSVLNVGVFDYFIFAIFNWLSPITTLTVAYLKFKIKKV